MKRIVLLALALTMLLPGAALAKHRDRNHDGIPDRWEARHHLSTKHNVAHRDPDRDGLANIAEFRDKTNPRDADTDNDGVDDGDEMAEETNPRRDDSDDDGVEDGQEIAGHVTSFDGTTLVITLNDNSTVSGVVNSATRIKCENDNEAPAPATTASTRDHGSDDSSGDDDGGDRSGTSGGDSAGDDNSGPSANSGPGNVADQSGDNQGDEDQGDDHGDDDGQNQAACSSADLTPGAVVHEADLEATSSGPVFEEVELVK